MAKVLSVMVDFTPHGFREVQFDGECELIYGPVPEADVFLVVTSKEKVVATIPRIRLLAAHYTDPEKTKATEQRLA